MDAINLDNKKSKGTHWVAISIEGNTAAYFDSFGIEYVPREVLNKIKYESITHNIFRIQYEDSIMCGFYFMTLIEYLLAGKTLLDYTDLFSSNGYK